MCMGNVWFPGEQLMGHALRLENGIIFGLNDWETPFLGSSQSCTLDHKAQGKGHRVLVQEERKLQPQARWEQAGRQAHATGTCSGEISASLWHSNASGLVEDPLSQVKN